MIWWEDAGNYILSDLRNKGGFVLLQELDSWAVGSRSAH